MSIFHSSKLIAAPESAVAAMEHNISNYFESQGYEVSHDRMVSGGRLVSITKGGMFKAIVGLRTSLNIRLVPQSNGIMVDASVGIFGQQAVPTLVTLFVLWPVVFAQIWGLVQQAKLDDLAIALAEEAVTQNITCPNCGAPLLLGSHFCTACGNKLSA